MKKAFLILIFSVCFLKSVICLYAQFEDVSELTLQKNFMRSTFETNKKFVVNEKCSFLQINRSGTVTMGKIIMTLSTPKGNVFRTYEIDNTSDIKLVQPIDLKKNPSKYIRDWQINIKVDDAFGSFEFHITFM